VIPSATILHVKHRGIPFIILYQKGTYKIATSEDSIDPALIYSEKEVEANPDLEREQILSKVSHKNDAQLLLHPSSALLQYLLEVGVFLLTSSQPS